MTLRELDEAMADEGRLADQKILGARMGDAPLGHGVPDPSPRRFPDDRMGHAIGQRIATARDTRLEYRPRNVPLEQMHAPAAGGGEVRDLMNEKTLARTRKSGEEHHPLTDEPVDVLGEPAIGMEYEPRIRGVIHVSHGRPATARSARNSKRWTSRSRSRARPEFPPASRQTLGARG